MTVNVREVTLSLDTSAYTSGDVLADTQAVAGVLGDVGTGVITSVTLLDKDDQGTALDLLFLRKPVSIGTENDPVSVSDDNADEIFGVIEVAAGDYVDLVNSQIVTKHDLWIPIETKSNANEIGIAAIARGTPTHTASGITLKIGIAE